MRTAPLELAVCQIVEQTRSRLTVARDRYEGKGTHVKGSGALWLALLSGVVPVVAGCGAAVPFTGSKSDASAKPRTSDAPAASGLEGLRFPLGTFAPHVRGIDACPACLGSGGSAATSLIPADALAVAGIQSLSTWFAATDNDLGTGTATGMTEIVGTPSVSGSAREFATTFTNYGDERYAVEFGADTESTNFFYDAWVYLASPSDGIANLEMDLNQVMANGQTVIYGFQCDGYSGTWDYTENAGTPAAPVDQWMHSTAPCDPSTWATDTWHHVQISFARDDAGNVTYYAVWLDGNEQAVNATAPSAFALGWPSTLLTNFQVDGLGPDGTSTVYVDQMTVYRW
jgi:hypothetical protein